MPTHSTELPSFKLRRSLRVPSDAVVSSAMLEERPMSVKPAELSELRKSREMNPRRSESSRGLCCTRASKSLEPSFSLNPSERTREDKSERVLPSSGCDCGADRAPVDSATEAMAAESDDAEQVGAMQAALNFTVSSDRCRATLQRFEGDVDRAVNALIDDSSENPQISNNSSNAPHVPQRGRIRRILGAALRLARLILSPVSRALRALAGLAFLRRLLMLPPPAHDNDTDTDTAGSSSGQLAGAGRESAGTEFARFFETHYGAGGPALRRSSHMDALRESQRQSRLLALFLVDEYGDTTARLCSDVLLSSRVLSLLSSGFVTWAGSVHRRETSRLMEQLRASVESSPHFAVLKPSTSGTADLVAVAHSSDNTDESHVSQLLQLALNQYSGSTQQSEEAERARLLREEQDEEYERALQYDREREEKERKQREEAEAEERKRQQEEDDRRKQQEERERKLRERRERALANLTEEPEPLQSTPSSMSGNGAASPAASGETASSSSPSSSSSPVTVAVKLPSGKRSKRRFFPSDQVSALYDFVESHGEVDLLEYALVQSYPRKDVPARETGCSLADAGIGKSALLIVESRE